MKTFFELESLGWSIKLVYQSVDMNRYHIFHAFFYPFGWTLENKTIKEVIEFCNKKIAEEKQSEELERFNLDR